MTTTCRRQGGRDAADALEHELAPCVSQTGRNIVVTGGTRGLGAIQARHALHCGAAHVTVTGRRQADGGTPDDGFETEARLGEQYGPERITYVQSDVRSAADTHALFDPKERQAQGLPPVVHAASLNAGIFGEAGEARGVARLPVDSFERVMDTNCTGVFRGMQAFTQAVRETRAADPSLVLIKSIYGSGGSIFSNAGYQASKFCVDGLTKQGAVELAQEGITVNSLSPGFVQTTMTQGWWDDPRVDATIAGAHPSGTWVRPESIGETAAFLLRAPRSVTGVDVFVDNGAMAESIPNVQDGARVRAITDEPCCGKEA